MNPPTLEGAVKLADKVERGVAKLEVAELENVDVVVAAPFVYLYPIRSLLKRVKLGAQDVFWAAPEGRASPRFAGRETAYTGEISVTQLKDLVVRYVIVGHSERRALGETESRINKKLKVVLEAGMTAVLCVGEPQGTRDKGEEAAKEFVESQIKADLDGIEGWKLENENLLIAYEPIWAVGTGNNAVPEDAAKMISFIKSILNSQFSILNSRVLYGGSTNAENIGGFMARNEIDGALVGGVSLDAGEFVGMVKIAGGNHR